jgi:ATP-dependent helicase YprA (DUF1998 family)
MIQRSFYDDKGERHVVCGTAHSIRAMDANDALACLALDQADDDAASWLSRMALRTIVASYGEALVDSYEDEDDDNSGLVNLDHLAWALTQARAGYHAEALEFITRALEPFPDAVAALDIISRKLAP